MVEIFADIPDGHPLFERFSLSSAVRTGSYFEDLLERRNQRRRGRAAGADRERLIGLAFRYVREPPPLGLLDTETRGPLLAARASFARLLPVSLQPGDRVLRPRPALRGGEFKDNLLFGRLAQDRAGAESRGAPGDPPRPEASAASSRRYSASACRRGSIRAALGLSAREIAAVDLVRCLVRRAGCRGRGACPGRPGGGRAEASSRDCGAALVGRGLVVVLPSLPPATWTGRRSTWIVRFERGASPAWTTAGAAAAAPEPVPA